MMRAKKLSIASMFVAAAALAVTFAGSRVNAAPQPAGTQSAPAKAQATAPPPHTRSPLVASVRDTGFVQVEAPGFKGLTPDQKLDAYYLSMAAIAVNPIGYGQNSVYGLQEKHLLEAILTHTKGIDPAVLEKIKNYTMLFWGNQGNHNDFSSTKFVPDFTSDELHVAAEQALKNGADLGSASALDEDLNRLQKPLFDPQFQPMLTMKNPPNGEDPLQASSVNFYQGVTLKDLVGFTDKYELNSRLVKQNGQLVEQVYRAGTPDGKVPPGMYARELGLAIKYLQQARQYAPDQQKKVIDDLVRYYQTGDRADWIQCGTDWVQDHSNPDFSNGFVEVYKDPRQLKGAIQGFVSVTDPTMNKLATAFATNAGYFEQRAPWLDKYKNPNPHPPVVNAVQMVIETGDFEVSTIGDNLPNEEEIHRKYGSKSFIITSSSNALDDVRGQKVYAEFSYSPEERDRAIKYGNLASDLWTSMHEVIGHGSGMVDPKLTREPGFYIKEYYSTLEESRADLMAMWNFWDPKLIEMGVMPNQEVAKAAYDNEARAALMQLHEVPTGDTIEEDHRRGTQLIVNYIRDKEPGAIVEKDRDGKVFLVVTDYAKMRQGVGLLLAELMRIKAEGDYSAARDLINKYGIHFNLAWRDQVVARYKALGLPNFWAGINPELELHKSAAGKPDTVTMSYPRDIFQQQLLYTKIAGE
jgi:dipeptidyl-peptidase-3